MSPAQNFITKTCLAMLTELKHTHSLCIHLFKKGIPLSFPRTLWNRCPYVCFPKHYNLFNSRVNSTLDDKHYPLPYFPHLREHKFCNIPIKAQPVSKLKALILRSLLVRMKSDRFFLRTSIQSYP